MIIKRALPRRLLWWTHVINVDIHVFELFSRSPGEGILFNFLDKIISINFIMKCRSINIADSVSSIQDWQNITI